MQRQSGPRKGPTKVGSNMYPNSTKSKYTSIFGIFPISCGVWSEEKNNVSGSTLARLIHSLKCQFNFTSYTAVQNHL